MAKIDILKKILLGGGVEEFTKPVTQLNASLESPASLEAMNVMKQQKNEGIKHIIVDTRSGKQRPTIGPRPEDNTLNPFDTLVQLHPKTGAKVINQGLQARPINLEKFTSVETKVTPKTITKTPEYLIPSYDSSSADVFEQWAKGEINNQSYFKKMKDLDLGKVGLTAAILGPTAAALTPDSAEAMPLGKLTGVKEVVADLGRSEDAFYRLIGTKLNLQAGGGTRKPFEVVDVLKNPKNDWRYVIVKGPKGERKQLPMTKDYLEVLSGAIGTKEYTQKFESLGLHGKTLQALKSLGIREEKRTNTVDVSDKKFRAFNEMQAAKAQEIDPKLLNDYSYVRNEDGQLLYMPKQYADFLSKKGYVKILKR